MDRTIIGRSITIDGDITSADPVVVEGRVKGRIDGEQAVVVQAGGRVEADVEAETLEVSGELAGNAVARSRLEITAEGRVIGDLRAPRIVIADGAHYKGHVEMDER